jgi:hypothetical protein
MRRLPEERAPIQPLKVVVKWDLDGSTCTTFLDADDAPPQSTIKDDREAIRQPEGTNK